MRASHALRWLAGGILVLWCGVFLRMETTEKSMVRALIVQPNRSGWAVQLLYQFPEAAADASDAVAEIRSCSAEDATLPLALHKAERELPKAANYRLCEYLLFDETASQTDILELEEFLQTEPVSRLSARVLFVAGIGKLVEETPPDGLPGSGAEPEETDAAPETLPGALLQAAEDTAARAPHLYECAAGAVIPILKIEENGVTWQKESCLLTAQGYTRLSPNETAMAQLLQERTMPVEFALEGEKLTQEYAALALGTAFHPYFVGSTFDPEAVGIEKQMLKKALEDEVNDKRLYCQRQANREFFGDSPAGVRQEGYLEEVDGLTPEALTEAYYEMLRTANIELIVLGCDEASTTAVKDALLMELSAIDRAPLPRAENIAMPRREPVRKVEHFDTTQAKLCMLFTLGRPMQPEQLAAVRLAMALYGGSVTSRLFLNVRERDHLCYYCSSSFQSFTGSMAVNSGVEHTDAARAEQAVLKELADLCDGPITDEELEDCRRGLLAGMNGLEDTLGGIETWYYMEVLRGGPVQTPDDARRALLAVTREDVRDILKQFTLSVSCLLTREEGNENG